MYEAGNEKRILPSTESSIGPVNISPSGKLFVPWQLIHFRPFTGSHCQTPVTNGKGRLDRDFRIWLENYLTPALGAWLKAAEPGKELFAVTELGPQGSGYALACFPDIWKDAIREKQEIEKVWRRLVRGRKA